MIDLILKDIPDAHVRENFFRLNRFLNGQVWFEGDFKLFDITIPSTATSFKIKHGLTFIPQDIIILAVQGNFNYYFEYQNFDRENIYVTTEGACRLRFLAGKLGDLAGQQATGKFDLVAPSGVNPDAIGNTDDDTFYDILRVEDDAIIKIENDRAIFVVQTGDNKVTFISGLLKVESTGATVVTSNSIMLVGA